MTEMTSGAALAARTTPPDLLEDVGDRAVPRPSEPAKAPAGADAASQPRAVPLAASDGRRGLDRDQASAAGRPGPLPDAISEPYLAPALKAAAAARARSARIRAGTEMLTPRAEGPTSRATPPRPATPPATAAPHGWSVTERMAATPARPRPSAPAAGRRFGGLSVAAAARAATIAFQPVRRPAAPAELPQSTEPAAAAVVRAPVPAPEPLPAPAEPSAPAALAARAADPRPLPAPVQPAAADPAPEAAPGSGAETQRFARTVAELERSLAARPAAEPGSGLVPRPTLPLVDPESSGRAWLRLWSRR